MNLKYIKILDKRYPSHEQIIFSLLLTFSGGFFDAYTFTNSNGIFANAQTGNLIFIGIEIANENYTSALNYLPAMIFFVFGVIFNEYILNKDKFLFKNQCLNLSLIIQISLLFFVYFFERFNNIDIKPLVISFVCAMQFDSFRKVNNIPFASIFCTGNLRSASEHLFKYLFLKKNESKEKSIIYFSIIFSFLLGVIVGGLSSKNYGSSAILIVIFVLIINLLLTVIHNLIHKK